VVLASTHERTLDMMPLKALPDHASNAAVTRSRSTPTTLCDRQSATTTATTTGGEFFGPGARPYCKIGVRIRPRC